MRVSKLAVLVLTAALLVPGVPKITQAKAVSAGNRAKAASGCMADVQKLLSGSGLDLEKLKDGIVWNGNIGIGIFGGCKENGSGEDQEKDENGGNENAQKPAEDSEGADYAKKVVKLVNEERAKQGLPALEIDESVQACANVRAKEIVKSFSHTRPDGRSCFTALSEGGVSYRYAGENIAYGYNSAKAVMTGWMNSSGHRANILSKNFTKIGVGYYEKNGVKYWTQFFIS